MKKLWSIHISSHQIPSLSLIYDGFKKENAKMGCHIPRFSPIVSTYDVNTKNAP